MEILRKWIKKREYMKSHERTIKIYYRILQRNVGNEDYCNYMEHLLECEIKAYQKLKQL
jgi:hypothetical protein